MRFMSFFIDKSDKVYQKLYTQDVYKHGKYTNKIDEKRKLYHHLLTNQTDYKMFPFSILMSKPTSSIP